ncbi:MAG: AI-2E family transporter [Oscillospiraceae bacterium]
MEKKLFRNILQLITFTVLLVFVIIQFDGISRQLGRFLSLLTPIFVGFAIAFVLNRPCNFFRRLYAKLLGKKRGDRMATPLAVATSYVVLFAVVLVLFAFIFPQIAASCQMFASSLGGYLYHLQTWLNEVIAKFDLTFLETLDFSKIGNLVRDLLSNAAGMLSATLPQVFSTITGMVSGIVTAVMAFVFSIYMLSGSGKLLSQCRRVVRAYLPAKFADRILEVASLTANTFTHFVSGQLIEACIIGSLCCVGMLFIYPDYAPLIGVIIGVSALIPIAGAYLGAILSGLLLVMVSPLTALTFVIFLVILQQLEGNIIYPRIVGTSLGLPAIWVLTAITLGGGLFGFVGMLVSVPVASVLYTLLRRDVHKRLGEPEAPTPAD